MTVSASEKYRLEDALKPWREHFDKDLADKEVELVARAVEGSIGGRPDPGRVIEAISEAVAARLRESVVPACLGWLRDQGYWRAGNPDVRARNEVTDSIRATDLSRPTLAKPPASVRPMASTLSVILGVLLGSRAMMFLLLPVTGEGSRYLLVLLGSAIGAAVAVRFLPDLPGVSRWLAWGVSRDVPTTAWKGAVRSMLLREADMALALCWSHPDRLAKSEESAGPSADLPGPVWDALRNVRKAAQAPDDDRAELVEALEDLLQRFEDAGYRWIDVARGSPYSEEMAELFQKYGMIEVGQPVEMLRSSLARSAGVGKPPIVVEPGMLKKMPHQGD